MGLLSFGDVNCGTSSMLVEAIVVHSIVMRIDSYVKTIMHDYSPKKRALMFLHFIYLSYTDCLLEYSLLKTSRLPNLKIMPRTTVCIVLHRAT